jgi:hypothetical protein
VDDYMLIDIYLYDNNNEKVKSGSSDREFNDKLCKIIQKMFSCEFRTQGTVKDTNDFLKTLELFFSNDFLETV